MKNYIKLFLMAFAVVLVSCKDIVDDLNENPNELLPEEIDANLFLTGSMLANTVAQGGHLNRIAGMWSGQLVGFTSLYSNIYGYDISTAESVGTWSRIYVGTVPNLRYIREKVPNDPLLNGISKVLEAHAIGTAASLFGNVPYSQINDPAIEDPEFDSQTSVFQAVIALLTDAIGDLATATSRPIPEDIFYNGNAAAWGEMANTLMARYYLQMKDYGNAYTAAQNGISSATNSMLYRPIESSNAAGDKNLFWQILAGPRTGDIGTGNSYMMQLLDPAHANTRNNAKTDETARFGYYYIDETNVTQLGFAERLEPNRLVTFEENQLILAECGTRTANFDTGLGHLNTLRQYLNTGGQLNANFNTQSYNYEDYVTADFQAGGMENPDNIDPTRALLREIIEERYISGFGLFMAFNDLRRLRLSDSDIAVPVPLNVGTATRHPERLPYSDDELNTNANAPAEDPGIYSVTEVNQ